MSTADFAPFIRFCFMSSVFLLNFVTLFHLLFKRRAKICIHSVTYGLTLIIINIFISIWIPYLFSSFVYETAWPLIKIDLHCTIQQSIPLLISTTFLILFTFQTIFETFACDRSKIICSFVFFIWILPQAIYLLFSHLTSAKGNDYYFMDQVLHRADGSKHPDDRQGILFCIERLDSWNVRLMTWHYVTLVVPLTSIYIICTGAKRFARSSSSSSLFLGHHHQSVGCECRFDLITFLCHYANFTWLLLFRPLLTLSALIRNEIRMRKELDDVTGIGQTGGDVITDVSQQQHTTGIEIQSLGLDLGPHFILLAIALVLPFSRRFGLFSRRHRSANNGSSSTPSISSVRIKSYI